MKRGQFYLISLTFAAITILVLSMFVLFVEFGSVLTKSPVPNDFENLQNAVEQRNKWIEGEWFDLRWKSRSVIDIKDGAITPANITGIGTGSTDCVDEIRVFNLSTGAFLEITNVKVNASSGPCTVIFNASIGVFEIYYNNTAANQNNSIGSPSGITDFDEIKEQVPQEGICAHFDELLATKNILFECSGASLEKTFNYSVDFITVDFEFSGNLP